MPLCVFLYEFELVHLFQEQNRLRLRYYFSMVQNGDLKGWVRRHRTVTQNRWFTMTIQGELFALQDEGYATFQGRLVPNVSRESIIGVRVPQLRKLARRLHGGPAAQGFLRALPHAYYDENMLHGLIISETRDYGTCLGEVDAFLPFVDNWAVCDILSPKAFRKNHDNLLGEIQRWSSSSHVYTCRFGIGMLMAHYLDEGFDPAYLEIPVRVRSDEYYVNMMIAWFFATALAKQWDAAIPYLENSTLDVWVHNKTIQKARESRRVTDEQKRYLKGLRR